MAEGCGTCVHWTPPSKRTDYTQVFRDKQDKMFGICNKIQLADGYEEAPSPLPLAVTKDGSDYKAILMSQAAFACVLWEKNNG